MREREIIEFQQIGGLRIFPNTLDYRTPHAHPAWEIILVLEQPMQIVCGQTVFTADAGEIVLFYPNETHELRKVRDSVTFLCLQISRELLPLPPQLVPDSHLPRAYLTPKTCNELRSKLFAIWEAYLSSDPMQALACIGQCHLVMHTILSAIPSRMRSPEEAAAADQQNARLNRLIRFVDENYMHKIRLSDFAAAEHCSLSYLSHFIKRALSQTFQEYVNTVRFHRACALMQEGRLNMLEICLESGFSDYRYFSNTFRQRCGMTPEAFFKSSGKKTNTQIHRSIHSLERLYDSKDSRTLLLHYKNKFV